jgi:hypothetical protein
LSFDIRQPSPAKILLFAPSLGAESAVVLLIYLNAALQSAAFAEKATICKNMLLASAAIMIWMLEYYQNWSRVCA